MSEFVSILMPAYNAERYVAQAIQSVLAQTHANFELLAIDDGSTDGTLAVLRSFEKQDARVKVISHANMGMGRSLNAALETAAHEWIFRMDADDLMLPDRIERQLAFLSQNPDLVVASSLVNYIDEDGKPLGKSQCDYTDRARLARDVAEGITIGFHHPAVAMRRSVILEIGGYRPQFWPADDLDLWNRVVQKHAGVAVQPAHLMQYRIHGGSVSVAKAKLAAQKIEWVGACIRARRAGVPEPSFEQFLDQRSQMPWPARLNSNRRDYARTLYKAAVLHFSKRHYARFVPSLVAAICLEPTYVLPRVLPRAGRS